MILLEPVPDGDCDTPAGIHAWLIIALAFSAFLVYGVL